MRVPRVQLRLECEKFKVDPKQVGELYTGDVAVLEQEGEILMINFEKAKKLLVEFKGSNYLFGVGVLKNTGRIACSIGEKVLLVRGTFPESDNFVREIIDSLIRSNLVLLDEIKGAGPNAPRGDLYRITEKIISTYPDLVISFGGGSTIDGVKSAIVLSTLGGSIDDYFGTGKVTEVLNSSNKRLIPHIAIQTVASSAAHLTRYSNITNVKTAQKKLVIDEAIVPGWPVFDYKVTYKTPRNLTSDGALDGMSHMLEALYGAEGKPTHKKLEDIAKVGIGLIIKHLPKLINDPDDSTSRNALCLATDLGGYSIMIGGTNGGHLTSFSLVDILSHGRACAILNPYYSVFFAPAIEDSLRTVGDILRKYGLTDEKIRSLKGRKLGIAVARAFFRFYGKIGFPVRLDQVKGFSHKHIEKALTAAKYPELESKLKNMPIPLDATMVDRDMKAVLEAAVSGNLELIKSV